MLNRTANASPPAPPEDIFESGATVGTVYVALLVVTALVAMIVNVVVFLSVHWIRRPMPPILKMSISLAAADALSSSIFAMTLFTATYLPLIGVDLGWLQLVLEMMKLSGILVTVTHLLALSLNHYIGILKPLHYNYIVTRRKVTTAVFLLWIFPTLFVLFLFVSQADRKYWSEQFGGVETNRSEGVDDNQTTFTDTFQFRMTYSSYFLISIFLMAVCYVHILIMVRKQQNVWKKLSRVGSAKWTGGRTVNKCSCSETANREQRQLEGNIRAIYTTLLILGSCVIGWMPALLIFVLMCKVDCYINGMHLNNLNRDYLIPLMSIRFLENMLVILKMLANPIIYSIRMKEIQESTKHMQSNILRFFCPSRPDSNSYTLASRQSPTTMNSSLRIRLTAINMDHVSIGRTELVNTLL